MEKIINDFSRTLVVAKISLGAELPSFMEELGLVSNLNDCFLMNKSTAKKMEVRFKEPNRIEFNEETRERTKVVGKVINKQPSAGDKFIGTYRDKGTITKVLDEYRPYVIYKCRTSEEAVNLTSYLVEIGTEKRDITVSGETVMFPVDIIAHNSSARDNVSALVLDSCLEFECALENKTLELSAEEAKAMNVREVAGRREHAHEVVLIHKDTKKVAFSFGKKPIMLESYFWQPQHSNDYACRAKDISFYYHQALDGIEVLSPTLYKHILNSLDFSSIREDLIILGMDLGSSSETVKEKEGEIVGENLEKFL